MVTQGLINKILVIVIRDRPQSAHLETPKSSAFRHVNQVIEYVNDHLADFDLEKMADNLYLSKYYLCHLFKKTTGLYQLAIIEDLISNSGERCS